MDPIATPELPSAKTTVVAQIVTVPSPGRLGALDYSVPTSLGRPQPGTRVVVPLGRRNCMGIVLALRDERPERQLRDVIEVLDQEPILSDALRQLVEWMASYYLAPLGEAYATALPGALRIERERVVRLGPSSDGFAPKSEVDRRILERTVSGSPTVEQLKRDIGASVTAALRRLTRNGAIVIDERLLLESAPTRSELLYEAATEITAEAEAVIARRPAVTALLEYLRHHPEGRVRAADLRTSFSGATAKLRQLKTLGLVREHRREIYRSVLPDRRPDDTHVELNDAQRAAVGRVMGQLDEGFGTFLLHGVTGSGKTEVYLRILAEVRRRAQSALLLVPEISLTHQLVDRVRARFGDEIAVLHSGLSPAERWDEWRRIARGEAAITIGARSAVFAPLQRVGLIVVDEEHDSAYKQADGVRYHGRDLAVMRAKLEDCPLVLGSATPSLESHHNAASRRYELLSLPDRVARRPLPDVELIDMRGRTLPSPLAPDLAAAIEANLAAGNQTLLFLNRRGFASSLQCIACGDPVVCPNCSVTMTWHRRVAALRCHYCAYAIPAPTSCATCGEPALQSWGWGTERLEGLLHASYPGARVARMDRDTTRRRGSLATLLRDWNGGKLDILIGTQMITKGHDVAGVTLVGVVMADVALNLPDFRSAERTFQQLAQVAGRAGRGDKPGRVLIQTFQPEHGALRAARRHDFTGFAAHEIEERRELNYPPFGRLVLLRFEGPELEQVDLVARRAANHLRSAVATGTVVLGPAPAPIERLRGRYRRHVLLRGPGTAATRKTVATVVADLRRQRDTRDLRILIDVDPQSLL